MSPRRLAAVALAAALVVSGCASGPPGFRRAGQTGPTMAQSEAEAETLDGTAELDRKALAPLSFERARLGARWLSNVVRDDGSFLYRYFPRRNTYDSNSYNELRHAGTTYSLLQVYGATRERPLLLAAEKALAYIDRNSIPVPDGSGRAFTYEGRAKLGGQALALIALLEHRRVTGQRRWDSLIQDLAGFVRSLKVSGQPGRYFQSYTVEGGQRLLEPDSQYYPSENLLALVRLEKQFPRRGFLDDAVAAANYLIRVRDGDLPKLNKIPREDHWIALALPELHRLKRDRAYQVVGRLQADSMRKNQHGPDQPYPARIGGSTGRSPINYTSSATKGEALVAIWGMAKESKDRAAEDRFSRAALRNMQFQMRTQFMPYNSQLFPEPARLLGAWGQDATEHYVRIDFVQHNISGLITSWQMLEKGSISSGTTLPG